MTQFLVLKHLSGQKGEPQTWQIVAREKVYSDALGYLAYELQMGHFGKYAIDREEHGSNLTRLVKMTIHDQPD